MCLVAVIYVVPPCVCWFTEFSQVVCGGVWVLFIVLCVCCILLVARGSQCCWRLFMGVCLLVPISYETPKGMVVFVCFCVIHVFGFMLDCCLLVVSDMLRAPTGLHTNLNLLGAVFRSRLYVTLRIVTWGVAARQHG